MNNKMQIVIGLMGNKFSGKDTLANAHIENYGATGKIILSEYLKNLCAETFKIPLDFFITEKKDINFTRPIMLDKKHVRYIIRKTRDDLPYDCVSLDKFDPDRIAIQKFIGRVFESPRRMLQYVGTELIQSYCKEFHAHYTYNKYVNKPGIWFITDLRFEHEYNLAHEKFPLFYPILIERKTDDKDKHASEIEFKKLEPFATIKNNSTIEKYIEKSIKVFKVIKEDADKKFELIKDKFGIDNVKDIKIEENANSLVNGKFVFSSPQDNILNDFDKYENN